MRASDLFDTACATIAYNQEVAERNGSPKDYAVLAVEGPPGGGKTSLLQSASAAMNYECDTFAAALRDAYEFMGGMHASTDGRYADYLRPRFVPEGDLKRNIIIDDIAAAQLPTLNACANLIQERMSGPHPVGRFCTFFATFNPVTSRAGSVKLPTQLPNRWTQVTLTEDTDDWLSWAHANDIDPTITGFIAWKRNEALYGFKPDQQVNATPRSWHNASKIVKMKHKPLVEHELLSGTISAKMAGEYLGFRRLQGVVKSVPEILANPATIDIPDAKEHVFATLVVLQQAVTPKNIADMVTYVSRINALEMQVFFMQGILKRDQALQDAYDKAKAQGLEKLPKPGQGLKSTKAAIAWTEANFKLMQ